MPSTSAMSFASRARPFSAMSCRSLCTCAFTSLPSASTAPSAEWYAPNTPSACAAIPHASIASARAGGKSTAAAITRTESIAAAVFRILHLTFLLRTQYNRHFLKQTESPNTKGTGKRQNPPHLPAPTVCMAITDADRSGESARSRDRCEPCSSPLPSFRPCRAPQGLHPHRAGS